MNPNRKETIVANDPGPCPSCPYFRTCTDLCWQVEMWVDQDSRGRSSSILLENRLRTPSESGLDDYVDYCAIHNQEVLMPDSDISINAWNDVCSMRLSDKIIRLIYSYYMLGKRIRDIAIDERASSQAIDQRHIQAKKAIAKRIKQRNHWKNIRGKLKYKSIRDYDASYLFFGAGYPRKIIAKVLGLHVSTIDKIISKKYRELDKVPLY